MLRPAVKVTNGPRSEEDALPAEEGLWLPEVPLPHVGPE